MNRFLTVCILFVSFVIQGLSQDVNFKARVSRTVVDQYSSFELQYSVNSDAKDFRPPSIKGLKVVSGPNRSMRQQIFNGNRSTSLTYTYTLIGNKVGSFTIFPATITVGGKEYKTDPIEIKVVTAAFDRSEDTDRAYFIEHQFSDTIVYVGQQIQVYRKLYTTMNLDGITEVSGPSYDDFFVGDLGAYSMGFKKEIVHGKTYHTQILKSFYLVPQKSGTYDLDPTIINMRVYENGMGFREKKVSVIVPSQRLIVKSLPEGAPPSFSGGVGKYSFRSKVSSTSITTDDALVLTLMISGNGDEQSVHAPVQPKYDLLESYEPTRGQESRTRGTEGIVMTKSYEYNYVPKGTGRVVLRPEFTYFDVDSLRYITLHTSPVSIDIKQGQNKSSSIEDFGTITEEEGSSDNNSPSFPWWLGLLGIVVLGGGVYAFTRKKKPTESVIVEKIDPQAVAISRLRNAKSLLDEKKHDAYYTELSLALNQYLEDKYQVRNSDRTIDNVKRMLEQKQAAPDHIIECTEIMKRCEMALYAKQSDKDMTQLYERTIQLIQGMES